MKTKSAHNHNGHRIRLRNLIDNVGLKNLNDIQIIEQILTMTNSRKDTNELAHRLLNKFGCLSKILDATIYDLMEVDGIGKVTAQMLTYLPQIFEIYQQDKVKNISKFACNTYRDIYRYFSPIFKGLSCECVYVGFVNNSNFFFAFEKLADGNVNNVNVQGLNLSALIHKYKAKKVVIAHNHPFGNCKPSTKDYDTHTQLVNLLNILGVELCDNIILDNSGFYSHKYNGYIRIK